MLQLACSEADKQALHYERYHHPHPRVQQRGSVHMTQDTCGKQVLPASPNSSRHEKSSTKPRIPSKTEGIGLAASP